MEYLVYERRDYIGILTISRPRSLNALNSALIAELAVSLAEIAASDIRCLIITGAGEKAFVAGADIAEMKDLTPDEAAKFSIAGNDVMEQLENLPMPVIAAINGYALGGGFEIALSCDIRIASEKAVFSLPEATLGILPGYGGVQRLVRALGPSKAKELAFTTSRINAGEALVLGLVSEVVQSAELLDTCINLAKTIAANSPLGMRAIKKVANDSVGLTLKEASRLEIGHFANCFGTADQREAMAAFAEKRKPQPFIGR